MAATAAAGPGTQASATVDHVDVQGWLTKRGALKKSWKQRFFTLDCTSQKLKYFKKDPSQLKKVPLPIATVNLRVYETVFKVAEATHGRKFELAFSSPGLRTFYLIAKSAEEQTLWMDGFKRTGMREIDENAKPAPAVQKAGYLFKMGEFNRTWRRRYFVLDSYTVSYHESQEDSESGRQSGQFRLSEYESISLVPESEHQQKFEFCISAPYRRSYFMAASSEAEMMSWIETLLRAARLTRSVDVDRLMKREFYTITPDGEGMFLVSACKEEVAETAQPKLAQDTTVNYRVHVLGGDQRFLVRFSTEMVSFISRATVKSFTHSQVYSYKFGIEDGLPVATFHPRIPNSRKCKVYKIVAENERVLAHMKDRFEGFVRLVIQKSNLLSAVVAAHAAANANELTVAVGEEVTVIKEAGDGMLLVRKLDGTTGLLPMAAVAAPSASAKKKNERERRMSAVPVESRAMVDKILEIENQTADGGKHEMAGEAGESGDGEDDQVAEGVDPSSSDLDSSSSSSYSGSSSSGSSSSASSSSK